MFRRKQSRREAVAEALAGAGPLAGDALEDARHALGDARHALDDAKFRKRLDKALAHGLAAKREARPRGRFRQLLGNRRLHRHLQEMTKHLQKASKQVERQRRRRRLARGLLFLAPAALFALPQSRAWLLGVLRGTPSGRALIEEQLELDVPLSTAYNQWTQFEEFPLFMEGVDDVRQLDDTRLHWVASIGGSRAEWDAKILEQVPDRRIVWQSTDGKETRGTVTFEPLGSDRTLVRLRMEYEPEGFGEAVGSAAGLDGRRVRGDLERFRQLIESRGSETGAWRGEVRAGEVRGGAH